MTPPLPYAPSLEHPEEGEDETVAGLEGAIAEVVATTARAEGRASRGAHAKSHGFASATLTVLPGLAPELAQGMFARPGEHGAILRFSTNPGDTLDDGVVTLRGVGLKVLGVEGARLPGSEGATTQDFVMENEPTFGTRTAKAFLQNFRLLAATTDRAQGAKKALSTILRAAERALEAVGGESTNLKLMGGARNSHPLGETYWTQSAFRHGDYVAKYALVPVSPSLTRLAGLEIDAGGRPDAIREEMGRAMREGPMAWELRAQLLRDAATMPVEDASVEWREEDSPFRPVARIQAEPQPAWSEARAAAVDDAMRFSPWTGIEAHRPLGAINRVRRSTYEMSAAFRARVNGREVREPATADLPR